MERMQRTESPNNILAELCLYKNHRAIKIKQQKTMIYSLD